jgi:hypothetical protein
VDVIAGESGADPAETGACQGKRILHSKLLSVSFPLHTHIILQHCKSKNQLNMY